MDQRASAPNMSDQEDAYRIPWLDVLRGIAILLMIPANFAHLLSPPHSLGFRIVSSYAAPAFIMSSAGMVVLTAHKHDLRYYVRRGGVVIGCGVLVDALVWHIAPFTSFDVLYLIGLALPAVFVMRRLETKTLVGIGLLVFVIGCVLQKVLGYHAEPLEISFDEMSWPGIRRIALSWLVDGWFPLFPWLGYSFFGAALFRALFARTDHGISKRLLLLSTASMAVGFVALFLPVRWMDNLANGGVLEMRAGYSEIFYPPSPAYMLTSLGAVVLLSFAAQHADRLHDALGLLGRYSMLVYISHEAIGEYAISRFLGLSGRETIDSRPLFGLIVGLTVIVVYGLCKVVQRVRAF
jgi:uncharacterized membrane protein